MTTTNTPMSYTTEVYRLLSIRGRLRLEQAGMTARGKATRTLVAEEFGLKPRDAYEKFFAVVHSKLQALYTLEQLRAQEPPQKPS